MSYSNTIKDQNNPSKKAEFSWRRPTFGTSRGSIAEIAAPSVAVNTSDLHSKHDITPRKIPTQIMASHGWGRGFWKPAAGESGPTVQQDTGVRSQREMAGLSEQEEALYWHIVVRGVKGAKAGLDSIAELDEPEED